MHQEINAILTNEPSWNVNLMFFQQQSSRKNCQLLVKKEYLRLDKMVIHHNKNLSNGSLELTLFVENSCTDERHKQDHRQHADREQQPPLPRSLVRPAGSPPALQKSHLLTHTGHAGKCLSWTHTKKLKMQEYNHSGPVCESLWVWRQVSENNSSPVTASQSSYAAKVKHSSSVPSHHWYLSFVLI